MPQQLHRNKAIGRYQRTQGGGPAPCLSSVNTFQHLPEQQLESCPGYIPTPTIGKRKVLHVVGPYTFR
jgi:hypothetical protein